MFYVGGGGGDAFCRVDLWLFACTECGVKTSSPTSLYLPKTYDTTVTFLLGRCQESCLSCRRVCRPYFWVVRSSQTGLTPECELRATLQGSHCPLWQVSWYILKGYRVPTAPCGWSVGTCSHCPLWQVSWYILKVYRVATALCGWSVGIF